MAMNFSIWFRHLREGINNVFRNGWMSLASIMAIFVALLILGISMLLVVNVNAVVDQVDHQVEISVFLERSTTESVRKTMENQIKQLSGVNSVSFISKDQGLSLMKESLGDSGKTLLAGFDDQDANPLPDAFEITVTHPEQVASIAKSIQNLNQNYPQKPIMKVNYGKEFVDMLLRGTKLIRNAGIIFVTALTVTSMFLVSNTIRVTIVARRREISVMKLVGATNLFIRAPFFYEGMLIGLSGSIVAIIFVNIGYHRLVLIAKQSDFLQMIHLVPLSSVGPQLAAMLMGLGVTVGVLGSMLSMRKLLKV